MKILHINDYYTSLGGSEKYLIDTCKALEDQGEETVIVSSSENEHISVPGRREYFVRPSFGLRTGLESWRLFEEIINREDPDIIHLHNTHCFVSPLVIKKLHHLKPVVKFVHDARHFCPHLGRKILSDTNEVCTYPAGIHCFNRRGCYPFHSDRRGLLSNLHKFIFVFYELRLSGKLDRIIVGSQYMLDELIRNGINKDKIRVIPCYTDKVMDNEEDERDENKTILCVGRFDGVKGMTEFIEALGYIKGHEWRAEIVGDGEFLTEGREKVKGLGLENRVDFIGRLSSDAIDRCYNRCRVVVMPSMIPESFGIVGIEAFAFGKPVIAFDSGGIKEWLKDGENGFMVRRGDAKGLSARILTVLNDKGLAQSLGKRGRDSVENSFRRYHHIKRLTEVYREAIELRNS